MLKYLLLTIISLCIISCNLNIGKQVNSKGNTSENYKLSLAQWSLHKTFFGKSIEDWDWFFKTLHNSPDSILLGVENPISFPRLAKQLGFNEIELVNTFYFAEVNNKDYWLAFKDSCNKYGVEVGLIMCDALGDIGSLDSAERKNAIRNHFQWIEIAVKIDAHSIRVNASGLGAEEEIAIAVIESLKELASYASSKNINILVENHYGYSSNGAWLANVMREVGMKNVGTLPDFGNFCIEKENDECVESYDEYKGMQEIMPFAIGVSAKSKNFDSLGNESEIDYYKMFSLIRESGFKGVIGVEYEGKDMSEYDGIVATKQLINRVISAY